jgi:ADP-ribose pyrophosphatase YjhB (NUDIX family)
MRDEPSPTEPRAPTVLEWARQVQAIAHNGLHFTQDPFDRERYHKLQELTNSMLAAELRLPLADTKALWRNEEGYATPKVDVRGAVFRDDAILLVRERADGLWSMPGGWVDVNDSPSGAVEREILEESGYQARAVKLAALYDRQLHPHPPSLYHIYKVFFLCDLVGGTPVHSAETDGVDFFPLDKLPELSVGRTLSTQIRRVFEHHQHRDLPTDFD